MWTIPLHEMCGLNPGGICCFAPHVLTRDCCCVFPLPRSSFLRHFYPVQVLLEAKPSSFSPHLLEILDLCVILP